MTMTVPGLHKQLSELIAAGHGRKPVCINKRTFNHRMEEDGAVILPVESVSGPEFIGTTDADEWLALIERLHNNGRGPWKFSDPESAGKLRGCRASLRRFIDAERAKDQPTEAGG